MFIVSLFSLSTSPGWLYLRKDLHAEDGLARKVRDAATSLKTFACIATVPVNWILSKDSYQALQ